MVGFVIDDDDVSFRAEFTADAADHLVRCLRERAGLAVSENGLRDLASGDFLSQLKGVIV